MYAAVSIPSVVCFINYAREDQIYSLRLYKGERNGKDLKLWPVKLQFGGDTAEPQNGHHRYVVESAGYVL